MHPLYKLLPGFHLYNSINNDTKSQSLCIRNVPGALCASEQILREIFTEFGQILSIRVYLY